MLKQKQNIPPQADQPITSKRKTGKQIIKLGVFLTLSVLAFLSYTYFTQAQIPDFVNYQGKLMDNTGAPITAATTIQFSLYSHITNGAPTDAPGAAGPLLWTETYDGAGGCTQITPGTDGIFAQHLGDCVSFPAYLDYTQEYYLGVKIGADPEATPRVPLSTHPYAFTARRLNVMDENIYITSENSGDIILQAADDILLHDTNDEVGTNGQLLSSTGTGIDWIDASSLSAGSLWDADHDTGIQVEEGVDDDTIRFDTFNSQRMAIDNAGNIIFSDAEPASLVNPGAIQGLLFRDDKFALRVGEAQNTEWNDANIGRGSFASGRNNIVSGNYSTALGGNNNIDDVYATAMGRNHTVTGSYSVAGGFQNTAGGYASTVFGQTNQATDRRAMAWGLDNTASQDEATAWGRNTNASANYATSWGRDTVASGELSTAFGYQNTASQQYGTAFGYRNTASGRYATVWGGQNTASGQYSTTWGSHNTASGAHSTAFGYYSTASAENGTAIGDSLANSNYMTAIGRFNENVAGENLTSWVDTDQLFVIGNGSGWQDANRSNALTILKNGTITAPTFSLAEINTAGNTALTTKEYVDNHVGALTWQDTFNNELAVTPNYIYAETPSVEFEDDGAQFMIQSKAGKDFVFGAANILNFNFYGGLGTATIDDGRAAGNRRGIEYALNYSADYTNRSLVDKEYVDNASASASLWSRNAGTGSVFPKNLTDKVGIGTNDPRRLLHLSNSAPYLAFTETDQGVDARNWQLGGFNGFLFFGNRVDDWSSGSDVLAMDRSGQVGIGRDIFTETISSVLHVDSNDVNTNAIFTMENTAGDMQMFRTDATPESDVTGSIGDLAFDSTNGEAYIKNSGNATNTGWLRLLRDGDLNVLWDADHDTGIQVEETADEDIIRFDTNGLEQMIIDNTGAVGIGGTPSPGDTLFVNGNIKVRNNAFVYANGPGVLHVGDNNDTLDFLNSRSVMTNAGYWGMGTMTPSTILHVDSNDVNTNAIFTMENTAGDMQMFRTDVTPESTITGSIGDLAFDSTNGEAYIKNSGNATNTGWLRMLNAADNILLSDADSDTFLWAESALNADEDYLVAQSPNIGTGTIQEWRDGNSDRMMKLDADGDLHIGGDTYPDKASLYFGHDFFRIGSINNGRDFEFYSPNTGGGGGYGFRFAFNNGADLRIDPQGQNIVMATYDKDKRIIFESQYDPSTTTLSELAPQFSPRGSGYFPTAYDKVLSIRNFEASTTDNAAVGTKAFFTRQGNLSIGTSPTSFNGVQGSITIKNGSYAALNTDGVTQIKAVTAAGGSTSVAFRNPTNQAIPMQIHIGTILTANGESRKVVGITNKQRVVVDSVVDWNNGDNGYDVSYQNPYVNFLDETDTSVFQVDGLGNVGIGTPTPSAQLHTTGTVRFASLGSAGGNLVTDANGNVTVSSDERLKNIKGVFNKGLEELLNINPIEYKWKEKTGYDTENSYYGFSAQNVQLSIPEAIGEDNRGYLTIADRPILATAINAIKELNQKQEESNIKIESNTLKTDQSITTLTELQISVDSNLAIINTSLTNLGEETKDNKENIKDNKKDLTTLSENINSLTELTTTLTDTIANHEERIARIETILEDGGVVLNNTELPEVLQIFADNLETLEEDGEVRFNLEGELVVEKITAEELVVEKITADKIIVKKDTVGTAKIKEGETSVTVETSAVDENSHIILTPHGSTPVGLADIEDGEGFTIEINEELNKDLKVEWFIVQGIE